MEKNNTNGQAPQGAAYQEVTQEGIRIFLERDITVACSCLNAIQNDQDLLDMIAQFMYGRYVNSQEALKRVHNES